MYTNKYSNITINKIEYRKNIRRIDANINVNQAPLKALFVVNTAGKQQVVSFYCILSGGRKMFLRNVDILCIQHTCTS